MRADGLDRLHAAGWEAAVAHGIRTVIDLRNDDEIGTDASPRPGSLTTVRVPLDDVDDVALWKEIWDDELDGSPLYFRLFLERKPDRCAAALRAIAHARPGGVVFHCGRGRDRTGLVALLVLATVGARNEDIVSDYELSTERVRELDAALGEADQGAEIAAILRRKETTAKALINELLRSEVVEKALEEGGFGSQDLAALQGRFIATT